MQQASALNWVLLVGLLVGTLVNIFAPDWALLAGLLVDTFSILSAPDWVLLGGLLVGMQVVKWLCS